MCYSIIQTSNFSTKYGTYSGPLPIKKGLLSAINTVKMTKNGTSQISWGHDRHNGTRLEDRSL